MWNLMAHDVIDTMDDIVRDYDKGKIDAEHVVKRLKMYLNWVYDEDCDEDNPPERNKEW